jgi:hypothetical protein
MAVLVKINNSHRVGNQLLFALAQIRDGLAVFKKYNGMRAQAIGADLATFNATFGVTAEGQAFSDRWAAISSDNFAGMSDFIDATLTDE